MVYPNEYIVKFYDGLSLVYKTEVEANSAAEAIEVALVGARYTSFNKIRIIKI